MNFSFRLRSQFSDSLRHLRKLLGFCLNCLLSVVAPFKLLVVFLGVALDWAQLTHIKVLRVKFQLSSLNYSSIDWSPNFFYFQR